MRAHPLQQPVGGQGVGDEQGRGGQVGDGRDGPPPWFQGEHVADVDGADDLVEAVAVDGEAGQPGGVAEGGGVGGGGVHLQGPDVDPRGHHVLGGEFAQVQGADEEFGGVRLQGALGGGAPGQRAQFLGGARGGQFLGGLQAEAAYEPVRGAVQMPDEGAEGGGERALRSGDHLGDGGRPGDRPVLRDQLADHHQHDGGHRHAQHGRRRRSGAAQSGGPQRSAQQGGQGRLGEHADHQGGDGDAELGAGQLERQMPYGAQGARGAALAGLGGAFQLTALDGGQGELGRDEHRAGQGQHQREQEQQDLGHRATPAPSRAVRPGRTGVARLLLGGSPIGRPSLLLGHVDDLWWESRMACPTPTVKEPQSCRGARRRQTISRTSRTGRRGVAGPGGP